MARNLCESMRIVSGIYKGRRFSPPNSIKARPTTDMAREALFNVMAQEIYLHDIDVLDLFAGTGAISLEFLSRGARSATAIEIDFVAKKFMETLKREWQVPNLKIVKADVFKLMKNPNQSFDLVFADPPYAHPKFADIPTLILNSGWLKKDGLLIIEHSSDNTFEEHPAFSRHRNYGNVNFTFFRQ